MRAAELKEAQSRTLCPSLKFLKPELPVDLDDHSAPLVDAAAAITAGVLRNDRLFGVWTGIVFEPVPAPAPAFQVRPAHPRHPFCGEEL